MTSICGCGGVRRVMATAPRCRACGGRGAAVSRGRASWRAVVAVRAQGSASESPTHRRGHDPAPFGGWGARASRARSELRRQASHARGRETRRPLAPPTPRPAQAERMFVELHAQSAFTFLEGAEQPETLVAEAARLGMPAIALVDRDGVYGAARFHRAAENAGVRALIGAELTLADGARLPVLVEDREGYRNLCRLITRLKLGAPKGAGRITLDGLEPYTGGLVCLTGGRHGPLAPAVARGDCETARGI